MNVSDIPAEEGVTGKTEGRPVAVYNSGEKLIVLENICTHMGCQTAWNSFEKSWDCPCHGSRYYPDGSVLRGPAMGPLRRLNFKVNDGEIILVSSD